jgi:hypothetical protein
MKTSRLSFVVALFLSTFVPVFRVQVYARTTKAVNYRHRGGSTYGGLSRH